MTITTQVKVIVTTNVLHLGFMWSVDHMNRVRSITGSTIIRPSRGSDMTEHNALYELSRTEVKAANCYVNSNVN